MEQEQWKAQQKGCDSMLNEGSSHGHVCTAATPSVIDEMSHRANFNVEPLFIARVSTII